MLPSKLSLLAIIMFQPLWGLDRKSSEPYISGDTFRHYSDFVFDQDSTFDPRQVTKPSIIFVKTDNLAEFFTHFHPKIPARYVLITHNSDYEAPGKFLKYLKSPKIIHWFGQNPSTVHKKFSPIPIGLTNQYIPALGNPAIYDNARKKIATQEKKYLLYVNFRAETNLTERGDAFLKLSTKPFCYFAPRKSIDEYLLDIASSYFVASPAGNGLDCVRTWEALLMGSIPIVKSSPLDSIFHDLPVVIVKDWLEITEEFLQEKLVQFSQKKFNLDKIYFPYWLNKMRAKLQRI